MIEKLKNAARSLVGKSLADINREFYGQASTADGCAVTVQKIFHLAGLEHLTPFYSKGEKFRYNAKNCAYCPNWVKYAKERKQWVTSGYRAGDCVLFDWDANGVPNHIGFIIAINSDGSLSTVEGNVQGAIRCMTRPVNKTVLGAYRAQYGSESSGDALDALVRLGRINSQDIWRTALNGDMSKLRPEHIRALLEKWLEDARG